MSNLNGAPGAVVSTGKTPAPPPPPPVTSVFGRIGAVIAVAGDYTSDLVDNVSGVVGATVSAALDTLDAAIGVVSAAIATVAADVATLNARNIIAGDGLDGGGNLSADVTINAVANADGSIIVNPDDIQVGVLATDAQHGNLGNGSLHTVATTLADGFMSSADKTYLDSLKLAPAAVAAAINVYISPTGNNADDGSIATPKQTIAGAYALLPTFLNGPFVVHCASGTYEPLPAPQHFQTSENAFIVFVGDGASQPGDDGFSISATGTADVGSTSGTLVSTGGLVASALIGQTIEMTSGLATGCRRLVNENTTTDVILDYPLVNSTTGAIISATAGDTFRVVRPAVIFDLSVNKDLQNFNQLSNEMSVHYVQLRLDGANMVTGGSRLSCFFGVEVSNPLTAACPVSFGQTANPSISPSLSTIPSNDISWNTQNAVYVATGGAQSPAVWEGWGLSDPTATVTTILQGPTQAVLAGYVVGELAQIVVTAATCSVLIKGGRLQGTQLLFGGLCLYSGLNQTPIMLTATTVPAISMSGQATTIIISTTDINQSGNLAAVSLSGQAFLQHFTPVTIVHTATTQACIQMQGSSSWTTPTSAVTVTTDYFSANISGMSRISWRGLTIVQEFRFDMTGNSKFDNNSAAISITSNTSTAVALFDQASFSNESTTTLIGTSTSGVLGLQGPCTASFRGAFTCTNNEAGANSNGIVSERGGRIDFTANPTVTIASAAGYGINLRGAGQAFFNTAPSNVVGVTADFTVGTGVGEDFADTVLSAAPFYVVAGMSGAQLA